MSWSAKVACAIGMMLSVVLAPLSLWGQASNAAAVSFGPVLTPYTTIAANAPYRVCAITSTGTPCDTTGVSIYSDADLTQPLTNPGAANSQGIIKFFVAAGYYTIQVTPTPGSTYVYYTSSASGGGSGSVTEVIAPPASWPSWLVPTVTNPTTVPSLAVAASTIPLAAGGTAGTTASNALYNLLGQPSPGTYTAVCSGTGCSPTAVVPSVTSINTSSYAVTTPGADAIGKITPYIDIRSLGAVIDGATPINTAVYAASAICPLYNVGQSNGASCVLLIPGGGAGALLGPTSTPLTYSGNGGNGGISRIKIQGALQLSSTLVLGNSPIEGDGGEPNASGGFVNIGPTAQIIGPNVNGSFASAITTPNATTAAVPTFINGSFNNFPIGSAITIADTIPCTASITRSSAYGSVDYYVATCNARTDIPPQAVITVTGCSDSSFNSPSNGVAVNAVDWPNYMLGYYGPVGSAGTATGCTITGLNYDTFESVAIIGANGTNCASGSLCFVPGHAHPAGALWGEVAIRNPYNNFTKADLENLQVTKCHGACLWAEGGTGVTLRGVTLAPAGIASITRIAEESSSSAYEGASIRDSELDSAINFNAACGVTNSCAATDFPAGLLCDGLPSNAEGGNNGNGCPSTIEKTTIVGAIYDRSVPYNSSGTAIPDMDNVTIERSNGCGVVLDQRYGGYLYNPATIKSMALSDPSGSGFSGAAYNSSLFYLCSTDSYSPGTAEIRIQSPSSGGTYNVGPASKYFANPYVMDAAAGSTLAYGRGLPVGPTTDGTAILGELRGEGASLAPSVVPFALLPTITLSGCSNCTITTGKLFEDGTASAVEIDTTSSGASGVYAGNTPIATYPGDHFLVWSWVRPGANNTTQPGSVQGANIYFGLSSVDTFNTSTGAYGMSLTNDGWHPQVAQLDVVTGNSTSHYVAFYLFGGSNAGEGNQFAYWGWSFIPGPNNPAYTGVTADMVDQWRRELYHGAIPENYAGGATGHAVTVAPIDAPSYNVVNLSTGAVTPFGTSNLADWTDSGVANGSLSAWNSTTSKWTPTNSINVTALSCNGSLGTNGQVFSTTGSGCQWVNNGNFSAGGDLSGTGSSQEVTGILSVALPAKNVGYLNWTGSAWAFSNPAGSGNTTSTSLTNNYLSKANGTNSIINSSVLDDGTIVSTSEILSAGSFEIGSNTIIPSTVTGYNGNASGVKIPLATAWTGSSVGVLVCPDSNGNLTVIGCTSVGDSITSPNSTLSIGGSATATTLDLAGAAGEIMAGATPALTYTPTLGKSGTAGTLSLYPASGNFTTTLGSAATASNTVDFFASVPTNLHLIYCAVSSTTCTLTDAGYAYNAIPFSDLNGNLSTSQGPSSLTGILYDSVGTLSQATAAELGTLLALPQYSVPYSAGTTSALTDVASPTVNGTYTLGWVVTGSAALAPTAINANTLSVSSASTATTATNATNVATTTTSSNTTYYLALLAANATENQGVLVASGPTYNPSTGAFSVGGGSSHGITIPAGSAVAGSSGNVVISSDATYGYLEANENNTGASRVCTAANGICAPASAIPIADVGSTGLQGTAPISVASTGTISVAAATTSALGVVETDAAGTLSNSSGLIAVAKVPYALTFNNGGSGAASGQTFDGSAAYTISYNTLGAAPTANPTFTGTLNAAALTASGTITLSGIEGVSTYCVQVSSTGVLSNTGAACGSGGGGAVNSVSNSDGSLTISPTTGSVVASLNLGNAQTWTAKQTFGTNISIGGVTPSGATGTGNVVFSASPALTGTPTFASGFAAATAGTGSAGTSTAWLSALYIGNGTYYSEITPASPAANESIAMPTTATSTDTFAVLGTQQTFTAGPKFSTVAPTIAMTSNQLITGTGSNLTTLTFPVPSGGVTLTFPITSEYMVGANSDTTTTHVLHATAVAGVFNSAAIAAGDLPAAGTATLGAVSTGTSTSSGIANSSGAISVVNFVADVTFTIASSTTINANSCSPASSSSGTSVNMTGLTSTMAMMVTPNTDLTNITGWGNPAAGVLYITVAPGSGAFTYHVCNNTGSNITTGGSATFNVSAR